MSWKNNRDGRAIKEEVELRVECPYCKHKNMIPAFLDTKICYWCKKEIKNNTMAHFKYKLRKELKNND